MNRKVQCIYEPEIVDFEENQIDSIKAGYGHTLLLSKGKVYSTGLNNYGQLGLDDNESRNKFTLLVFDIHRIYLPKIEKIFTGKYNSYIVDEKGSMYSFGKGGLGHRDSEFEDIPRKIELNTQNRQFTMIACDQEETIAFSPMSLLSINPKIGPSCGGTRLNLLCTGVFNTELIYVGFKWNMNWTITEGTFDKKSKTIWTITPNFDEYSNINIPCSVDIMISLDKQTWIKSKFYFIL